MTVGTAEERASILRANMARVAALNHEAEQEGSGVRYAINTFGELTEEQFRNRILLPRRPAPAMPAARVAPRLHVADLPSSFDWRNQSIITPVRDQGSVGTCWAFSAVGAIEAQRALHGHGKEWLSVEQVADCDNSTDPDNIHADCGVFGGWPYLAYQYVKRAGGLQADSTYSYCSGTGQCYPCPAPGWNNTRCGPPVEYCLKNESCAARFHAEDVLPSTLVASWAAIAQDEVQMQARLVAGGPLSVLMDATGLQFYRSGVWAPKFCSKVDTDHAVLLVGYGDDNGNPYWIIKNSWGVKWGEAGYFRLQRGHNMCAISTGPTLPSLA